MCFFQSIIKGEDLKKLLESKGYPREVDMAITMSGIASGMDTQNMVDQLMQRARIPIMRMRNENQRLDNKLSAWSTVDTNLSELQSSTQKLSDFSNWDQKTAESSDQEVVTASASTDANSGTYDVDVTQLAESHQIASDSQSDTTSELGLSGEFTVGGETVSVSSSDTLENIRDNINNAASNMSDSEAVEASIVDSSLVITRNETGSTKINISDSDEDVLQPLGVLKNDGTVKNELQAAQDLTGSVNNIDITRSDNTGLTDIVEGVTLNFQGKGTATVDVSQDTDSVVSMVQGFVDNYNSAMQAMEEQGAVQLDDQGQIEDTGPLSKSNLLNTVMQESRELATRKDSDLPDGFDELRDIGISTSGEANRLSLDTDQLEQALRENPQKVEDLFRDPTNGVVTKLDNYLNDSVLDPINGSVNNRQEEISSRISRNEDSIAGIENRLDARRETLESKFANMEETLSKMNSELSFIQSKFGVQGASSFNLNPSF